MAFVAAVWFFCLFVFQKCVSSDLILKCALEKYFSSAATLQFLLIIFFAIFTCQDGFSIE